MNKPITTAFQHYEVNGGKMNLRQARKRYQKARENWEVVIIATGHGGIKSWAHWLEERRAAE